ncbi:type VII secretion integral membrane protein EccD [Dactylosporangium sp. NBC_01737]|uniref:type VII secretion integral membrane protein EccD n=1 Tax=Dactylosporangium sp. NBC_01737 TaxID=2975959 RepID=UPI002E0F9221|nr:type VII secretion integral membrane protein EccD [Dactylosporangium sp. NBC_01737]
MVFYVTAATTSEMCRLAVYGPHRRIDIAVPVHVPIADLLPTLLRQLQPADLAEESGLADSGLEHGGWVLQRLGEAPLDENLSLAEAGLHDGDTVHLLPRADQIPPIDFDDLIDGVATAVRGRAPRWLAASTRAAALTALGLVLALGWVLLALPGPAAARIAVAVIVAVLAILAAWAVRVTGDRIAAAVLAAGAAGFAAVAGLLSPDVSTGPAALRLTAPNVLAGAVAVFAVAVLTAVLVDVVRAAAAGLAVAAGGVAGGALLAVVVPIGYSRAAATLALAATIAATAVPMTAFRLAGMRLAPLPTEPGHLQEDLDPIPSAQIFAGAARIDRVMLALYGGLAVTATVGAVAAAWLPGWAPATVVILIALARILGARPMTNAWHRLTAIVPAAVGLVAVTVALAVGTDPAVRLVVCAAGVPVAGAILYGIAVVLPGRRLTPYWGRAGDVLQWLATCAAFPVLFAVLDLYQFARGLRG